MSVVTISFNQAEYLRECIESVLNQEGNFDLQYIVVDPGSKDTSRSIIDTYGDRITRIYERDNGPADGLNRGFRKATGEYFLYLNSDDILLPGAIQLLISKLENHSAVDVVHGGCWIIDEHSKRKRKCHSDKFSLFAAAYGMAILIQPSSAFRSSAFKSAGGFNSENRSNWDGELFIDMAINGARFMKLNCILSEYRIHAGGITGTGKLAEAHHDYANRMFEKIMRRSWRKWDEIISIALRILKHLSSPSATIERLRYGSIFGSANG